jgi:hypothetical protein
MIELALEPLMPDTINDPFFLRVFADAACKGGYAVMRL